MNELRIVLLAPIQFNEEFGIKKEQVIIKSNQIEDISTIFNNKWNYLNGSKGYMHDIDGCLDISDSIKSERNLDLYVYDNFISNKKVVFEENALEYTAYLFSDKNFNFFIIYDFKFNIKEKKNIDNYLNHILFNRNIFERLKLETFQEDVKNKSLEIINKLLKKLLHLKEKSSNILKFTVDSNYPFIILNGMTLKNPTEIFKNEEDIIQRSRKSEICTDYGDESFLHIGWNYTLISNLPKNINQKLFCMMVTLQINYYQIRFYKLYFQNKIKHISSQALVSEKDIQTFDKLKISYHKYFLDYRTYKSGLYPKMYKEFVMVEELWHMHDDIDFIDKTFDVQKEYINKTYQIATEKNNRKINAALSIIAFLQIAAIYGIVKDSLELKEKYLIEHTYTNYSVILILIILLPLIISPFYNIIIAKLEKRKKK
jgi:hypothetical protein